jgi:taurine dioxygenase
VDAPARPFFFRSPHQRLGGLDVTLTEHDTELDVTPLSGTIGAVLRGIDLRDLDDATVAAIRRVWLERKVIFFPGQHLDPESHQAFAARFGEPTEGHPIIPGLADFPNVFEIDYTKARNIYANYGDVATRRQGLDWHTDVTFVKRPPLGSILRAVEIPAAGGDTLFSDQRAAFEELSSALQEFLLGLTAVHDGRGQFAAALDQRGEGRWEGETVVALEPVVHPVVRTHPETGGRALFVNPGFTSHIVELERSESDALLAFLYRHAVRPEFTVRYHWSAGDVGFWDNRTTQHSVVGDFGSARRVIQRVTLRGDEPF